jgi:hypothetical protein
VAVRFPRIPFFERPASAIEIIEPYYEHRECSIAAVKTIDPDAILEQDASSFF